MARWPYNTTRWKKLRLAKLNLDPLCEICTRRGKLINATVVDHIKAIKAGGSAFAPLDELMSLCVSCHNEKTARVDRPERANSGRRFQGFDRNGEPLDTDDDWFGERSACAQPDRGRSNHQNGSEKDRRGKSRIYLVSDISKTESPEEPGSA
ncbi:HNH endonuclease [Labrenzia sp. THAF82]|uniref:HNH endonuclease signature motif containing protein n=1 Tax=Labrenzia sp. THAF82 TaxID=2587861 RepID=UPI001268106B|nr:HNH endonuclease signature motif containing protein [Labrenzia sp. THAF82]QFT30107.1 HNH endonuclease [Labrenzia sp. THAF82]